MSGISMIRVHGDGTGRAPNIRIGKMTIVGNGDAPL